MESLSSTNITRVVETLKQIKQAILQLQEWNSSKSCADEFLRSPSGMKDLAASSMLIIAVGEGFKNIDKITESKLLPLRPEYPWKEVKGIRDKIAHGYFDIDHNVIFEASKYDLPDLIPAIDFFIEHLNGCL